MTKHTCQLAPNGVVCGQPANKLVYSAVYHRSLLACDLHHKLVIDHPDFSDAGDVRILTVRQWRAFVAEIEEALKDLTENTEWGGDDDRLALGIPDELPWETPKCESIGCTNDAEVVVKFDSGVRANICSACLTLRPNFGKVTQ